MAKRFFASLALVSCVALGCAGSTEIAPTTTGAPKDTATANKGMTDAMSNPNMPPEMKKKMEMYNKGGAPGGAPGGGAPGGAAPPASTPASTPEAK